jgi:hypothetical protein
MLIKAAVYKESLEFPAFGQWRNWYLINWPLSGDGTDGLAAALFQGEAEIHCTHVRFLRCVCAPFTENSLSNWGGEEDATLEGARVWFPHTPHAEEFRGLRAYTGTPTPNLILHVAKVTKRGRSGKWWLRGALHEGDIFRDKLGHARLLNAHYWDNRLNGEFLHGFQYSTRLFNVQHTGAISGDTTRIETVENFLTKSAI